MPPVLALTTFTCLLEIMNRTKTVLINRAVPGSGKTTFSNCIYDAFLPHSVPYGESRVF